MQVSKEKERVAVEGLLVQLTPRDVGHTYYVISKSWWTRWQRYVLSEDGSEAKPDPIESAELFAAGPEADTLKDNLLIDVDYVVVPGTAWTLLKELYVA